MFDDFDISILADKSMNKDELLDVLESFYSKENQEKDSGKSFMKNWV